MTSSRADTPCVPGTEGYERSIDRFVEVSLGLDFTTVCKAFIPFLPSPPARILDIGAGAGQNAAALSEAGYAVVAVEPMEPFLAAARARFAHLPIDWLCNEKETFDFVLVEAVWHHLHPSERAEALENIAPLLAQGGKLAISLRNGPAGLGTRVFPTETRTTLEGARQAGLECICTQENIRSVLPNKDQVRWSRIVLSRRRGK